MRVADLMQTDLSTVPPDAPVAEVVQTMADGHVSGLPEQRDRDILLRAGHRIGDRHLLRLNRKIGHAQALILEGITLAEAGRILEAEEAYAIGIFERLTEAQQSEWDDFRKHVSQWERDRYLEAY